MNLIIIVLPSHLINLHPIIYGLILLCFTLTSTLNMSLNLNNYWFSFITFLIIIGGLMIIFLYFTSFISNMKMSLNWSSLINLLIKNMLLFMFLMLFIFKFKFMYWSLKFNEINSINSIYLINLNNFSFMFNYFKNFNTIICMIYLLMCLTLIVKLCIVNKHSLRKIN
nr:NADH dehydrogenase subunit 6 [Merostenus sp.]